MAVISLKSLPVGFRFRPTDEELVNYYLKSKINGGEAEINVIPEVDVCKCEPWDVPAKSLIKTEDPEWFFFSPRNRMYPTGHRSKRATEAGYWKSTGRDRCIRSRTTVIGMKKTLVFHRGRAPNGEKTEWIMHEYRVTDSDAYVLCRLFKQPEEKAQSSNCHEVEDSGASPAPTSHAQHAEAAVEVSETLSIQEISGPDMQESPSLLPAAVGKQPDEIESQLGDEAESAAIYPLKPVESNYDSNMASASGDHKDELGAEIDPLLQVLDERYQPQSMPICLDGLPPLESSVCLDDFFDLLPQSGELPPLDLDNAEGDEMTEFLNSMLNLDDYSSKEFCDQNDQTINPISPNGDIYMLQKHHWDTSLGEDIISSSAADSELRILQNQAHEVHRDADVSEWSYKQSISSQNLNDTSPWIPSVRPSFDNIYGRGHVSQFVRDGTSPNVIPMDTVTEIQQYTYNINSFAESTIHKSSPCNNSELGGTGIKIRPRQSQLPAPSSIWQQGTAVRRLRLQMNHPVESVCSNDADESSSSEEHEVCSANTEGQEYVKKHSDQHITEEEELLPQVSTDHAGSHLSDGGPLVDLTPTLSEVVEKPKHRLRLRKLNDSKGNTSHPPRKEVPKLGARHIRRIAFASLSLISSVVLFAVVWDCFKH